MVCVAEAGRPSDSRSSLGAIVDLRGPLLSSCDILGTLATKMRNSESVDGDRILIAI